VPLVVNASNSLACAAFSSDIAGVPSAVAICGRHH
jgi:hypothetical protein